MPGNASQKLGTTAKPPWMSWRTRKLVSRAQRFIETYCIPAKGVGFGKPMKLADWQLHWLEEVLAEGVQSSALTLPRGNGKSTFCGAVATWALFDGKVADEFGGKPDIPVIAVTLKQALKGVYGAALDFRANHKDLTDRSLTYSAVGNQKIMVPGNHGGELYPISADPDGLQGLDPMLSLVDELGFIDIEAWDALLLAAGKRPRSLALGLGTKNPADVPNALDHLLAQVSKHGDIPGFHLVQYAADDDAPSDDREQWRAANPALSAGYLQERALEQALALSPEPAFRTFRLNIKTGSQTGWLGQHGPTVWDDTEAQFLLSPDMPTWVGVDKSARGDCSAVVAVQVDDHGLWWVDATVFTPEAGAIDHGAVRQRVRDVCETCHVNAVGYDERYFVEGADELEQDGLPMVNIPQTPQRLVPAFSTLYELFHTGMVRHQPDPTFRQHVLSAVPKFDVSGGFTLAKNRSRTHIDAAVALGIAAAAYHAVPVDEPLTPDSFRIH